MGEEAFLSHLDSLNLSAQVWFAIGFVLLAGFLYLLGRPLIVAWRGSGSLRALCLRLHRDDGAIASIEFLLVLIPFMVIVMTVWQYAFMVNAKLHVGYATFAAARSAAVIIPAEYPSEPSGLLLRKGDSRGQKWKRIQNAATVGTIAISPGLASDAVGVAATGLIFSNRGASNVLNGISDAATEAPAKVILLALHRAGDVIGNGSRVRRSFVKAAYADAMTDVYVNETRWDSTLRLNASGPENVPDLVKVSVTYEFWLHLPFVGRMIEAALEGRIFPPTGRPLIYNPYPSIQVAETMYVKVWNKKRAIDPCT